VSGKWGWAWGGGGIDRMKKATDGWEFKEMVTLGV